MNAKVEGTSSDARPGKFVKRYLKIMKDSDNGAEMNARYITVKRKATLKHQELVFMTTIPLETITLKHPKQRKQNNHTQQSWSTVKTSRHMDDQEEKGILPPVRDSDIQYIKTDLSKLNSNKTLSTVVPPRIHRI